MRKLVFAAAALWAIAQAAADPLKVETRGEARYVSGGVGEEERLALAAMRGDFNLQLLFAVKRAGNYLADVEITVLDAGNNVVLSARSEGPFFLARLAPGTYTVAARYGDVAQSRSTTVRGAGRAELAFYWDDPAALEGKGMEPERERKRK